MSNILTVKGLTKRFFGNPVLEELDFSIESGRVVGLMGPNGAGKTTLIKTIMQLYRAEKGEITILGKQAGSTSKAVLSYMPDTNPLISWMRINDALQYYGDMFPDFDEERAGELCEALRLDTAKKVTALSKGTVKRVLVMLALSRKAALYLLDEPFAGIDPLGTSQIIKTILTGVREDASVLIATHQVKNIETIVDDILFLNNGRLVLSDSSENVREFRGKSVEECYLEVFSHA